MQGPDNTNWLDRRNFNVETTHETDQLSSQPYSSFRIMESKSLQRTSSYPEQQQQQQQQHPYEPQNLHHNYSSEPNLIQKLPFTSYPPPGGRSEQPSPNGQSNHSSGHQLPISSSNLSPYNNTQHQLTGLPPGAQFGGNLPQLPHDLPVNGRLQNQWGNQNSYPGRTPMLLTVAAFLTGLSGRPLLMRSSAFLQSTSCFNKYDSIVQSFLSQGSPDAVAIGADVAKAISREMPVELLRASLPHTSDQQRKLLLEFVKRSMPVAGLSGGSGSS